MAKRVGTKVEAAASPMAVVCLRKVRREKFRCSLVMITPGLLALVLETSGVGLCDHRRPSQPEALNLAGCGLRQLSDEVDPAGVFVGSEPILAECEELRRERIVARAAVLEDDKGFRLDELVLVGTTNDGRLDDCRMLDELRFDLEGRAPNAAHLQHVVAAAAVIEISFGVATIGVTGIEPAVDHRGRGTLGVVPVAACRRVAGNEQAAALAIVDFNTVLVEYECTITGYDAAARSRLDIGGRVGDENVQRLRGTDAVQDPNSGLLVPSPQNLRRQRFTGGNA